MDLITELLSFTTFGHKLPVLFFYSLLAFSAGLRKPASREFYFRLFFMHLYNSKKRFAAYLIVAVQFGCLLYILVSAPVIAESYHGILIQASGLFLGLLAIYTMQIGNFNVTPLVLPDARIVKSGIYRIIRHPMYLSLLLVVLALLLDYYDWKRLLVATILILNLGVKISMEERELLKHFDEYKSYMSQTKRLIPFIY